MGTEQIEVVIVGGGQAGLAMSYCLTEQGRPHVVLERARIAESWRSRRWDSLRLIGPNWTFRLPGIAYQGASPDSFMSKHEVVARLEAYAGSFNAPVREGVRVTAVERDPTGSGFLVRTDARHYDASQVVIATGALQRPFIPDSAADFPRNIVQFVPYTYRNPQQVPPGAVLVVGSGQSGCQIAEDLRRAERTVYLSVTRSWGMSRRYRGQDAAYWARATGWSQRKVGDLPTGVRAGLPNPQLTGTGGGHDLTLYTLARDGVVLVGRLRGVSEGTDAFDSDLAEKLAWGDEQARCFVRSIDESIEKHGLDAPTEAYPSCLVAAGNEGVATPEALHLEHEGISAIVWATGYRPDFEWVGLPFLDADGYPIHRRGVTVVPRLYILGLDWLFTAHSSQFGGMSDDAVHLATKMADERTEMPPAATSEASPFL